MTIRVLHTFGAMNRGGAEMRALDVMRKLDPAEVRLEFCALSGKAGTLDDEIRGLGGDVHHLALGAGFPVRFAALIRRHAFDVVHSNVALASGAILALAAAARIRTRVAHFHSTGDERGDSPARRLYRRTMRGLIPRVATHIVGCSAGALDEGWRPDWRGDPRCRVVFYGLDVARFEVGDPRDAIRAELGLAPGTPLILSVGRFDWPKNQPRSVDVVAPVAGAHLVFVGRGGTALEAETRARVEHHRLGARVHFLGERSDVPRLLAAADVMLLTSTLEGLPGVVLEAAAAGTPVVATDLPGVREIAERVPGIQRLSLDQPDPRWAEAITAALVTRPTPVSRAEARARFRASPFSIEACVAGNLAVWRS